MTKIIYKTKIKTKIKTSSISNSSILSTTIRFAVCLECLNMFHFHAIPVIPTLLDSIPNLVKIVCPIIVTLSLQVQNTYAQSEWRRNLPSALGGEYNYFYTIPTRHRQWLVYFWASLLIDYSRFTLDCVTSITFRTRLYRIRQLSAYIRSMTCPGVRHA